METFSAELGVAGYCNQYKKSIIIRDIVKNNLYYERLDIESILPIYMFPIKDESEK